MTREQMIDEAVRRVRDDYAWLPGPECMREPRKGCDCICQEFPAAIRGEFHRISDWERGCHRPQVCFDQ